MPQRLINYSLTQFANHFECSVIAYEITQYFTLRTSLFWYRQENAHVDTNSKDIPWKLIFMHSCETHFLSFNDKWEKLVVTFGTQLTWTECGPHNKAFFTYIMVHKKSYLLSLYILGVLDVGVGVVMETTILPPQSLHLIVLPPLLISLPLLFQIFTHGSVASVSIALLSISISLTASETSMVTSSSSKAACFPDFDRNSCRLLCLHCVLTFVRSDVTYSLLLVAPISSGQWCGSKSRFFGLVLRSRFDSNTTEWLWEGLGQLSVRSGSLKSLFGLSCR